MNKTEQLDAGQQKCLYQKENSITQKQYNSVVTLAVILKTRGNFNKLCVRHRNINDFGQYI